MREPWTFYKLVKLQALFDQDIFEIDRLPNAYEVDEGFEIEFYGEQSEKGEQVVPPRKLQVTPVIEDGKARIKFEVTDLQ